MAIDWLMNLTKSGNESLTLGRHTLFGIFSSGLLLLSFDSIRKLITLALTTDGDNSHSSYVLLIPFISAVLIYSERARIFCNLRTSVRPAALVFVLGGLLFYASRTFGVTLSENAYVELVAAAVIAFWLGGFVLIYGSIAFKAALFPLTLLLLTIPIPTPIIHRSVLLLQRGSADLTSMLFTLAGTPFYRSSEFVFKFPGLAIEVAEECSGIRSTIGMLVVSLLAAHLLLRSNWKRMALLIAVVPVSMFKNAIRIVTLTLLAMHYDMGFLTGRLHHEGGVVFMAGGLLLMYPILAVLVRFDEKVLGSGVRS